MKKVNKFIQDTTKKKIEETNWHILISNINGNQFNDDTEMANLLKEYIINIGSNLAIPIPSKNFSE